MLEILKLLRKDFDDMKIKISEKSGFQEIKGDIKNISDSIKDVKDCLKTLEVKFNNQEKQIDKQEKRIDQAFQRLDAQNKELHSLREELRKTKDRVVDTECEVGKSAESIKLTQTKLKQTIGTVVDVGARSRRNNIIFHGIPESQDEDKLVCMRKVKEFIKDKCKLTDKFEIEAAHRLGREKPGNIGSAAQKPRPMIAKFLNRGEKEAVMKTKAQLPADVGMTNDFPREIRLGRKQLIPRMLEEKNGKQAFIVYPCRLIVDGREVEKIDPAIFT